jgi:hypothetical protein
MLRPNETGSLPFTEHWVLERRAGCRVVSTSSSISLGVSSGVAVSKINPIRKVCQAANGYLWIYYWINRVLVLALRRPLAYIYQLKYPTSNAIERDGKQGEIASYRFLWIQITMALNSTPFP